MKSEDDRALREANKVYGHEDVPSRDDAVAVIVVVALVLVMLVANC